MYIPPEHDLTINQLEVRDIPLPGRYLVTGGPGCGKTIIALYRTMYIKRENPDAKVATFLFTNALYDYFGQGIEDLKVRSEVYVWAKWQMRFLRNHGQSWPEGDQVPWDELSSKILKYEIEKEYDHLIIDEAQDFRENDLQVMNLLADNITIFADTNQSIRDLGSEVHQDRIETIKEVLSIDEEDCFELEENHRNTKYIIDAAIHLAPEEFAIDMKMVKREGAKPKLVQYTSYDSQISFISRIVTDPRLKQYDIAILHLQNERIHSLYKAIKNLVKDKVELELLRRGRFDFSRPSVKFCTLDSVKGLEFDIVIMPSMSKDDYWVDLRNMTRIYVGMTRARHDLLIIYPAGNPTPYLFEIPEEKVKRINLN